MKPGFVSARLLAVGAVTTVAVLLAWALGRVDLAAEAIADAPVLRDAAPRHPVIINQPAFHPRVDLGVVDDSGRPVTAACSTCHSVRTPNTANSASQLDEFHVGMHFAHGTLSCLSCHNPDNYDALRLADGTSVEFGDVMTLCAQCHGPQTRDYRNGSHGGMTGYWDLTRGPRQRNNCVDCHDPHAPQFPRMQPTFKPRDRFLDSASAGDGGDH